MEEATESVGKPSLSTAGIRMRWKLQQYLSWLQKQCDLSVSPSHCLRPLAD